MYYQQTESLPQICSFLLQRGSNTTKVKGLIPEIMKKDKMYPFG